MEQLKKYLEYRLKTLNKLLNANSGIVTNDAFEDVRILGQIGEIQHLLDYIKLVENEK